MKNNKRYLIPFLVTLAAAQSGAVAAAGGPVWPDVMVQLHAAGKAFVVDPKTDTVVATLDTCGNGTLGSTTPDAGKVYVSCAGENQTEVVVLDLNNRSVAKRLATGNRPKHGLVSPDGKLVGVDHWALSDGKLHVAFIDTARDEIVKSLDIEVKGTPTGVTSMHNAWTSDSRYFFTLDRVDSRLVVVDTRDFGVKTIAVPSVPHYPVLSPNGKELWLIHEGGAQVGPGIVVFDITKPDLPVVAQMAMPLIGEEVVEAHHGNFTQDGKLFMALNRGPGKDSRGREIAFFDVKTRQLVHRLTTASSGVGHSYNTPDGKYAVITNYGNNVITIVDVKELKTVKDLRLGKGRMGHVAFTPDSRWGYVSNAGDGNLYKLDMRQLEGVGKIATSGGLGGGGQVLNVWTNAFEELPRR